MRARAARWPWSILFVLLAAVASPETPPNFKVAFFGDQGLGGDAVAVLDLVKAEGAQAVVHLGDFDYDENPTAWEAQINSVLGRDFPYLALIGNHDESRWNGADGYQRLIEDRLTRLGISWEGDLGVQSTLHYGGILFVMVAPGITGSAHDLYLRDQLAEDSSVWKIAAWHKNQRRMQVGGKLDETGWGVYEEARKAGAIVATAHEHSYSRTHLLSGMESRTVASTARTLSLARGQTFAFVSGLGGESIRPQLLSGDWWASIYTSSQGAAAGALFGVFNADGVPNRARFYFKDVRGRVPDQFEVVSTLDPAMALAAVSSASYRAPLAPESIASAFGSGLASGTHSASGVPLPTTLGGTTLTVRDSTGSERPAPLYFVSPTQVNFQVPPGTATGVATLVALSDSGRSVAGATAVATVAPGLFTANADGKGVPAAQFLRVRAGGEQSLEAAADFDPAQNRYVPRPVSLGPESDQVFLVLYGTGLRFRSALSAVSVRIGDVPAEVTFAAAQGTLVGLDQVNVRLPRSLAGRGVVVVALVVEGQIANVVEISVI